jgi:hypothetical protein
MVGWLDSWIVGIAVIQRTNDQTIKRSNEQTIKQSNNQTNKQLNEPTNGAEEQNRTADTAVFSRVLYQLSYLGVDETYFTRSRIFVKCAF